MFDLKHKILSAALGVLFILLCLALWSYVGAREDRVRAETTQKVKESENSARDAQIAELKSTIESLKKEQADKLAEVGKTFAPAQTPEQIAALVAKYMGTKQPITFVTPPATPSNPNPQPVAQVAVSDAPQIKAYLQECETCKVNLTAAAKQLDYAQQQQELLKQNLLGMTQERDAWKTAAHGGPFWKRFGRALKYIGIGAGAGAVALCATGHCK